MVNHASLNISREMADLKIDFLLFVTTVKKKEPPGIYALLYCVLIQNMHYVSPPVQDRDISISIKSMLIKSWAFTVLKSPMTN